MPRKLFPIYILSLVVTVSLALPGSVVAQAANSDKKVDIRQLLVRNGSLAATVAMVNDLYKELRAEYPKAPEEAWRKVAGVLDPLRLMERHVDIYDKTFTHDEIKEMLKFYESPVGVKMAAAAPQLTMGAMKTTSGWFKDVTPLLVKILDNEAYK